MVIYKKEMNINKRENMRGGQGTVTVTNHAEKEQMEHCRLFCEMSIPPNGSVGEHDHVNETEYYLIKEGIGIVVDDGVEKKIGCGDMIITGGGASHSIRNMGTTPLVITAVIITDAK
ncbi:MAG: cupin domain-containing protein [Spirochaetaceae bacterium]|jgi:mannose-6-phosphate isomerase-like protein (cupin superfamily)|nr:cupin domain-containing protein [Spirochaetaceae bacterium]